jgi:hypothetical protein
LLFSYYQAQVINERYILSEHSCSGKQVMTQAYPLHWPQGWPKTPPHKRTYNWQLNRATLDSSRHHLYDQLRMLGATQVVLSTNIPLRKDGEFYANKMPDDHEVGVAVYFQLRGKPMAMARDCYNDIAQNLRSLGLAIEHLRGLDRHGGASMLERAFAGFASLPPPEGSTREPAVEWRQELGPVPEGMEDFEVLAIVEARYRAKAKNAHSDQGGSDAVMIRLNLAIAQARQELRS